MLEALHDSIAWKQALLAVEDHLLQQAQHLYSQGFRPPTPGRAGISAVQMAAVDEKLQTAVTLAEAVEGVGSFLSKQLHKLRKRRERTGQVESWLLPTATGSREPLGEVLKTWLAQEHPYLPPRISTLTATGQLELLRRFWNYFYGLYRYDRTWGACMVFVNTPSAIDRETKR
jgi:hypothetical protein